MKKEEACQRLNIVRKIKYPDRRPSGKDPWMPKKSQVFVDFLEYQNNESLVEISLEKAMVDGVKREPGTPESKEVTYLDKKTHSDP